MDKIDGKYWRTALNDRDKARKAKKKPKLINGKKPLDHAIEQIESKMKQDKKVKKSIKGVHGNISDRKEDKSKSKYKGKSGAGVALRQQGGRDSYGRTIVRDAHKKVLSEQIKMKKPNLPKSEKDKLYTKSETVDIMVKSMCKMMEKAIKSKKAKTVVEDVLDANYVAEVDADAIPSDSSNILWKKDANKKGVNKLKSFIKEKKK